MNEPKKIDLIDSKGNLREHLLRESGRTLCGRSVQQAQPAVGNAPCKVCRRLAQRPE